MKELEDAVVELAGLSELSVHFSSAVQAFANRYQPGEEVMERGLYSNSFFLVLINYYGYMLLSNLYTLFSKN